MMYVFAVNCKQDIMTDFKTTTRFSENAKHTKKNFLSWCQMTDVFLFNKYQRSTVCCSFRQLINE